MPAAQWPAAGRLRPRGHQPLPSLELLGWDFLPAERKNFCQLRLHFFGASWVVDKVKIIRSELSLEQGPDMLDRAQASGVAGWDSSGTV